MVKLDKRVKRIAVVDTETLGVDKPLIYDFAVTITDKKGNIYAQKNWIIKEVFEQKEKMQSAYYSCKLPKYDIMIGEGSAIVSTWETAKTEFNKMLHDFDIKVLSAYNLGFDKRALTYTNKCLGHKDKFLTKKVELWDIWGIATQTIMQQKTFHRIALRENWYTEKGNVLSNAEVAYRYITNDMGFIESHTALHDTEIETVILAKCLRQNKKMESGRGIFKNPWKTAQRGKLK
ncbi:MAG: hypothetical protein RR952_06660 [Cetobacterium sp.]